MERSHFTKLMLTITAGVLVAATLSSFIPASGEEEVYTDVIRLHVIAESDSPEDQALKLSVRDAVLDAVSERMAGVTDYGDAHALLSRMLPEIEAAAEARAAKEGSSVTAEVYFDREEYPVRYYEDYVLPAGEYVSLRVVLGEGEGQNWWCVLFPSMCREAAVDDSAEEEFYAAGFTPEEYRIIKKDSSPKYKVRFRLLELIAGAFGFDY